MKRKEDAGMAMVKKVIWLPYDFDTAIGINNEGQLTFGYSLEDTDTISGADVYNGQDSTFWCNLRDAFYSDLSSMYNTLRSIASGVQYSYPYVEGVFEEHQSYWCANIYNQDAQFKYLDPLYNDGDAGYLEMLQGSKAEQRKWWLYNRFKYLDSKYVAGDSRTQVITLRGYAVGNITVTPYADIYTVVNWANSYTTKQRVFKGQSYTHVRPLSQLNDTEIYIYTAPQIKSVGDLSSLYVGYANFSLATKLTEIKIGSSAAGYNNYRAYALTVGNNTLLKKVDATNCSGLGDTTQEGHDQTSVDFSGCSNIEEIYLGGTNVLSVNLPIGSTLEKLVLPGTITSLIVRNQVNVELFTCPDLSHVTTLWLDNVSNQFDAISILDGMAAGSRVRLFNFEWTMQSEDEVVAFVEKLDTMMGLDQSGGNMNKAQVYATIHLPNKSQWLDDYVHANYPEITLDAVIFGEAIVYRNFDSSLVHVETVLYGGSAQSEPVPVRDPSPTLVYTFSGWSSEAGGTVDPSILTNITSDTTVYACYTSATRYYTVLYYQDSYMDVQIGYASVIYHGDATVYTDMEGDQQTTPTYAGTGDPEDYEFAGWSEDVSDVTHDMRVYAIFVLSPKYSRQLISGTLSTYTDVNSMTDVGAFAFAGLTKLVYLRMDDLVFSGGKIPEGCFLMFKVSSTMIMNQNIFSEVTEIEDSAFQLCSFPANWISEFNFPAATKVGNTSFNTGKIKALLLPLVNTIGNFPFLFMSGTNSTNLFLREIFRDQSGVSFSDFNETIGRFYLTRYSASVLNKDKVYQMDTPTDVRFSRMPGGSTYNDGDMFYLSSSYNKTIQIYDIGYVTVLGSTFYRYEKLETLIMRASTIVTFTGSVSNIFTSSSPLGKGEGSIYVPQSLLSSYQSANVWSAYSAMFRAIEGSEYQI